MTPSHSNKKGVRYRYYVSNPVLHKQHALAGSVSRIPAPDIEALILDAVANQFGLKITSKATSRQDITSHIQKIEVHRHEIIVTCAAPTDHDHDVDAEAEPQADVELDVEEKNWKAGSITLKIPCSFTPQRKRKGIASLPDHLATIDPATRDAMLIAIARSMQWIDDLTTGKIASFEDIADQEGKVVRHIRFLAPLAFVSPKVIMAIMQSDVPADLSISSLARNLPHDWSEQARQLGLV